LEQGPSDPSYYNIMMAEVDRINLIASELLLLSKPQAFKFEKCDLVKLIDDVVVLMSSQAILKNISINVVTTNNSIYVYCESNKIKQVFINLIKNSIESMELNGEILININDKNSSKVEVSVRDQGCGISENLVDKLGEPFYTTKDNGVGLGLMVTYKIIESHNGTVNVTSEVGKGTTFSITLPVKK
jgi:signal transduction histidine kinase